MPPIRSNDKRSFSMSPSYEFCTHSQLGPDSITCTECAIQVPDRMGYSMEHTFDDISATNPIQNSANGYSISFGFFEGKLKFFFRKENCIKMLNHQHCLRLFLPNNNAWNPTANILEELVESIFLTYRFHVPFK